MIGGLSLMLFAAAPVATGAPPPLRPVPFTDVRIADAFWAPRLETSRRVTIPACFEKCEETGRLANFARAGGLEEGPFEGIYYNDSDVYKVIEGASYALAGHPDPALDAFLDRLIAHVAAAQADDGYLNTYYALAEPGARWTDVRHKHELYCAGHLLEAAVAHHQATGKRSLLDVAVRLADHVDSQFGPDGRHDAPGHEEIEIGLVRLARVTGERRYLALAKFFIDQRGRHEQRESYGTYGQDHAPVVEQDRPVGHAVRAMYLYCGMTDVAAETGDAAYLAALDRIWRNLVGRKLYLTGGVGARRAGEAFGDDYELPNETAYAETCAAVGLALWSHRMALVHRDASYVDVLERVLYNGFLSGVSLGGDRFFYPNPLASRGDHHRSPWFSCSCCPVNVARLVPSIGRFAYAHDDAAVFVNLFVAGEARVPLPTGTIRVRQTTAYPWDGRVAIVVDPERATRFALCVRLPGWARGRPVPSDLYAYVEPAAGRPAAGEISLAVNGAPIDALAVERGYVRLDRTWAPGDEVTLALPMPIRRVRAHERVEANRGRLAIERGPVVYCVEAADTDGGVRHLWLPEDAPLTAERRDDLLGGVTVIRGRASGEVERDDGALETRAVDFAAIPYYAWDHREAGEMAVWVPTRPDLVEPRPAR